MKRRGFLSLFLFVLILAFCGAGIGITTAAPVVEISPSETTVNVGDDFDVYIAVDPDENELQMVKTDLGFDSSKVSLTVENGGMFTTMFHPGTQVGDVVSSITGLDPGVSTAGNLAVLHMHANNPGTFTLDLSNVTVGTATGTLTPIVNNGTVTIVAPAPVVEISPSETTVNVGDDFDVYIAVDPDENELQMVKTDLGFDSSKVSLTVENGGMFTTMFHPGTQVGDVVSSITGLDPGVSTAGNLAVLHMHANNPGTFTLDLSNVTVGTATGTLTPIVNNGTVTITECPWDLTSDGLVNIDDVLVLISHWGTNWPPGDFTGDENINIDDVLVLIAHWGACP